jgi:hypothetical protein
MAAAGAEQSFFIAASTDAAGAEVMAARIREQMEKMPELAASGTANASAFQVSIAEVDSSSPLSQKVQAVAARMSTMMRNSSTVAARHK